MSNYKNIIAILGEKMDGAFLIVVIGLSGCGKSYMIDYVLRNSNINIKRMVAITTRPPRKYEKDGIDKIFRTEKDFAEEEHMNKYCFVNEVYNNKYAFYCSDFISACNFICELYYKNYQDIKEVYKNCRSIYIRPLSINVLETKLLERGSSEEEVVTRLQMMKKENYELEKLAKDNYFDYIITNDFSSKSICKFEGILEKILKKGGE